MRLFCRSRLDGVRARSHTSPTTKHELLKDLLADAARIRLPTLQRYVKKWGTIDYARGPIHTTANQNTSSGRLNALSCEYSSLRIAILLPSSSHSSPTYRATDRGAWSLAASSLGRTSRPRPSPSDLGSFFLYFHVIYYYVTCCLLNAREYTQIVFRLRFQSLW